MAYVIAQPCVDNNDQACIDVCPVDCITADKGVDRKFYVDPGVCIDCGACAEACPNEAIFRSDELPAEWTAYARVDAAWYRDPQAARAAVNQLLPLAG
jgi:NAD-dependent dihydropyrimidine dehydrogenase PreA subunit